MMKKIALVHTVRPLLNSFEGLLREAMPGKELQISNTLDEFLASDANVNGFTQENLNRLFLLLKAKELEQPDIIVVTCSTLSPSVDILRPLISTGLVTIDAAMLNAAVSIGGHIAVLATAQSTVGPTVEGLTQRAAQANKKILIDHTVIDEAYIAMKSGDGDTHDHLVLEAAEAFSEADVIVLAQASMGHLREEVERRTGTPALSSPHMCVQQVKQLLEN